MQPTFDEFDSNGMPHGIHRAYHPNGRLAREATWDHGVEHGMFRQWSAEGVLLGEYEMKSGDGMPCEWHENGKLKHQAYVIGREFNGPVRIFDETGALQQESYMLRSKLVSKKRYLAECAKNPRLPPPRESQ